MTDRIFRSFWMGGFEGADHINGRGVPLDMTLANGHAEAQLDADYARAAERGIRTIRESIGWRLAEPAPGRFDFGRLQRMAEAARRHGLQVLWTFMHYGTPADVDLRDDRFIDRFAAYAGAVAQALADLEEAPVVNLVNEIGFVSWAAAETGLFHGYRSHDAADSSKFAGYAIKRRVVRGLLAGMDAVRHVSARTRFLHIEPIVHVVAPRERPDLAPLAREVADYQWQVWDLIAGRLEPELGGSAASLDIIGINHYHAGQWEVETEERLHWHLRDERRVPFRALIEAVWQRYRRPLFIAETSHVGDGRAEWLHETLEEVEASVRGGVPVSGVCLYPLVDRPDWEEPGHWHHSGLWDVGPGFERQLCCSYAEVLTAWQAHPLPTADA